MEKNKISSSSQRLYYNLVFIRKDDKFYRIYLYGKSVCMIIKAKPNPLGSRAV